MGWSARVLGVAVVLALGTGCFEVDLGVTVLPDGSVGVHESVWLTRGVVDMLWDMGKSDPGARARFDDVEEKLAIAFATPSGAQMEALRQGGVVDVQRRVGANREQWGAEQTVTFGSFAAMTSGWTSVHDGDVMPGTRLDLGVVCDADRVCVLSFAEADKAEEASAPTTPFDDLADALKGAGGDPADQTPSRKASKKEQKAAMERVTDMLALMSTEVGRLRIAASLTVPGQLLEPLPAGATASGSTVTWTMDGTRIMGAAMGDAGAPPAMSLVPDGALRFRLADGVAVPAGWTTAP